MKPSRWFAVASALCLASVALAQLDTSPWPVAGQGRTTRESVLGMQSGGSGLQSTWHLTGLGAIPVGPAGAVLSSDGYLWFRSNGVPISSKGYLFKIDTATGAIAKQVQLGAAFMSAPIITADRVYVSYGDGSTDSGINAYDRLNADLPLALTMRNAAVNTNLRSLQLGAVTYSGSLRIYAVRRTLGAYSYPRISAWDITTGQLAWETVVESAGNGGQCQLGPLWTGSDGKQYMALANNASPYNVTFIRDDDTTGTVAAVTALNTGNYVFGQGALSADGQRIYYNGASDGGKPALYAVKTDGTGLAWSVPQSEMAVNCYVANPAVVGDRVYLACAGGNVACVQDNQDGTYTVRWVFNVGETGEFTSISAGRDTSNRTYLYCSNQTSHKLYRVEDLGTSATVLAVVDFTDSASYGSISTTIDDDGSVYQFGGANGGLYKFSAGMPPVADAGPDITGVVCYDMVPVNAGGSYAQGGATLVNYEWNLGSTTLYSGPSATTSFSLPACANTFTVTLTVRDSNGFESSDTLNITVGPYPAGPLQFVGLPAPETGSNGVNSLASDGTYLYWLNGTSGHLFRYLRSGCSENWETLASAPGSPITNDSSNSLAYAPGLGTSGSLITYRMNADNSAGVATVYDLTTGVWTQYNSPNFGGTGYVVAGNYLFGNAHAAGTNQGGHLTATLLNATNVPPTDPNSASYYTVQGLRANSCTRSSLQNTFDASVPTRDWFSRVVQMSLSPVDGLIYGIKNDWTDGGTGDRLFRWNPASYVAPHINYKTGPSWDNWTGDSGMAGEDLGQLPVEPGQGSAIVALPANWKGMVGAQGGVFLIFGRHPFDPPYCCPHEGFGAPNITYGIYDTAAATWQFGSLPGYSSNGTAATLYHGDIYIKQGASNETDPSQDPTATIWVSLVGTPPVADAGGDLTGAPCYEPFPIDGSASHAYEGRTIVNYRWTCNGRTLYDGPLATPNIAMEDCNGTFEVTLTVCDSAGFQATDTINVTVGYYPPPPFHFSTLTAPESGSFATALASSGDHLYFLNQDSGGLYRTEGGLCAATWETLASAPGSRGGTESGSLAFTPGFQDAPDKPSLITYRTTGAGETVATVYDIQSNTWTQYQSIYFGNTGFVVAGDRAFGNLNAWDTNLGGPLTSLLLNLSNTPTDPNDFVTEGLWANRCWHSSLRTTFEGQPNDNWFGRVVQQSVVENSEGLRIYGIKNDWVNGLSEGDRLYKWNPADWAPPHINHYIGPEWYDWQNDAGFMGVDLGQLPVEIGYGSAVVGLPPLWKDIIGPEGGVFVVFGRHPFIDGANEGWGAPNDTFGYYDIASSRWYIGTFPEYSSSGTSAALHDGELYIKQGASDPLNPDGNHTTKIWVASFLPPLVCDAGGPYTYNGVGCGTQQVPVSGTAGGTITEWTWREGAHVVGTGPHGPLTLLPGTHVVTLTVSGADCTTGSDTAVVTVTSPNILTMPILVAMDSENDVGYGPSITAADADFLQYPTGVSGSEKEAAFVLFGIDGNGMEAPVTTILPTGGKWWFGPWVDLSLACYGMVDLSAPDLIVSFTATFYQDSSAWDPGSDPNDPLEPYEDAPIFVSLRDVYGHYATIGIVYGSDMRNDPEKYPNYKTVEKYLDIESGDMTESSFDLSRVVRVEFHGTDWGGQGLDWVSIRNLYIGPGAPRGACCLADNSCQYTTADACADLGGTYKGDGVACTTDLCTTRGACCLTDNSCQYVAPDACTSLGGTYQGDGVECTTGLCAPALCPGDGNCDGVINWRDIDYLVAAQNDNVSAWQAKFASPPTCDFLNLDTNLDDHVNWRDIDPFIAVMNTTCQP